MINNSLIKIDQLCDFIPYVSTATNATTLIFKAIVSSGYVPKVIQENNFAQHLCNKSNLRCFVLLVPRYGNIAFAVYKLFGLIFNNVIGDIPQHPQPRPSDQNSVSQNAPKLPSGPPRNPPVDSNDFQRVLRENAESQLKENLRRIVKGHLNSAIVQNERGLSAIKNIAIDEEDPARTQRVFTAVVQGLTSNLQSLKKAETAQVLTYTKENVEEIKRQIRRSDPEIEQQIAHFYVLKTQIIEFIGNAMEEIEEQNPSNMDLLTNMDLLSQAMGQFHSLLII